MAAKNPFDELYDKISYLLDYVRTHSLVEVEENKIPKDIEQRLDRVQRKLENFNRISEDIIRLSGVSDEELKKRLEGVSDEVPEDGQELIQRGRELKAEAEVINDKLERAMQCLSLNNNYTALPETPKEERVLDDKEYIKKRKGKFRRFGGDSNWKPL